MELSTRRAGARGRALAGLMGMSMGMASSDSNRQWQPLSWPRHSCATAQLIVLSVDLL